MIVGTIKKCPKCGEENYIPVGITQCPECDWKFDSYIPNKAPAGWVKMENYEISRRNVEKMVDSGELSIADIKDAQHRRNLG